MTPVECPRNFKAFNFTLCGKSTSKTSTLFPTKKANPHKSNHDQQRTVLQRVKCKKHHVKIIISSDQRYPSPFYEQQTFSSELFCSSVLIDMTVKKAQKGSLYENYFGCASVDRKTKTNASEGISCSK